MMEFQWSAELGTFFRAMGWGLFIGLILMLLILLWRKLSSGQFFPHRTRPTSRLWFYLGILLCVSIAIFFFWQMNNIYIAGIYLLLAVLFLIAMVVHWRRWRY